MGYRAPETPLGIPKEGRGTLRVGAKPPRQRSANYVDLPDVPHIHGVAPVSPDRNDKETAVRGMRHRYARHVPALDPKHREQFRLFVRKWAREHLTPIQSPMSFEEWLATESYNESRKAQLRKIHSEIVDRGGAIPIWMLRRVKAFIKSESYPEYKHARHINARCDAAKVIFGPIVKRMEEEVYKQHEFIKHVPLPQRPALLRALKIAGAKYVESDHTAFEAHFTVELQTIVEFEVCRWLLKQYPEISVLLEDVESGENYITMPALDLIMKISGIRCSGDMWTSLFNGLGNLMAMKFACSILGSTCDGFVEGDDGIFAVHGPVPTPELMSKLGFEVKMVEHDDPATASFCGMILAGDSIIRDPRRFFQTFGWTDRYLSAGLKVKRSLALAKSLSALYETPNCPLVAVASRYVYERTRGVEPRWDGSKYRQVPKDFQPPETSITAETRDLFAAKFGVSPAAQLKMEERIAEGDWSCLSELQYHHHVGDYYVRYVEAC